MRIKPIEVLRDCLIEAGEDLEVGLLAAEYILSHETGGHDYPRNNSNQFLSKKLIAEAARDDEKYKKLRDSIPEDQRWKLDRIVGILLAGGTVHHPSEPPELGINLQGEAVDPAFAKYKSDKAEWEKRGADRIERRKLTSKAVRSFRSEARPLEKINSLLKKAGATRAELRKIAKLKYDLSKDKISIKDFDRSYEDIMEGLHSRIDEEETVDREPTQASASLSMNAALASVDVRGVEHRGKGSSQGGQFVAHGQGGDDIESGVDSEGFGSDPQAIDDGAESGSEPEALSEGGEEAPAEEGAEDIGAMTGAEDYDGEMTDEDIAYVESVISMYPQELQDHARKLTQGRTVSFESVGEGVNSTAILSLEDGTKGVFKDTLGEQPSLRTFVPVGTYYKREIAASLVAHTLGFGDLVPITVPRKVSDNLKAYIKDLDTGDAVPVNRPRGAAEAFGSIQSFVENSTPAYKYAATQQNSDAQYGSDENLARAALFDYIILNSDRHSGNWMVKESQLATAEPYRDPAIIDAKTVPPEEDLLGVPDMMDYSDEDMNVSDEMATGPFQKWEGATGISPGSIPEELPEDQEASSEEDGIDLMEDLPMAEIVEPDYSGNQKVLIDNPLSFPTAHRAYSEWDWGRNARLIRRAINKNLPMPDVSHMKEAWPRVEAALIQAGLEPEAIVNTKRRFEWATSGEAKTIGDLRNPFESQSRQKTIRDHLSYIGHL